MSVTRSQTEKRVDENQNLSELFDEEFDEKKYENFYIGNIYTCPTIITNRKTEFSSNTLRSERIEDNQTFIPEHEIVHHSKLIKGQVDESYVEIFVSTERDIPFNFDNI